MKLEIKRLKNSRKLPSYEINDPYFFLGQDFEIMEFMNLWTEESEPN